MTFPMVGCKEYQKTGLHVTKIQGIFALHLVLYHTFSPKFIEVWHIQNGHIKYFIFFSVSEMENSDVCAMAHNYGTVGRKELYAGSKRQCMYEIWKQ